MRKFLLSLICLLTLGFAVNVNAEEWNLVTSVDELVDGDIIALTAKTYTGKVSGVNKTAPAVYASGLSNNLLTCSEFKDETGLENPYEIMLQKSDNSWILKHVGTESISYIVAGDKKISEDTTDPQQRFSISIGTAGEIIIALPTGKVVASKTHSLQYNPNLSSSGTVVGNARFTFYSTNQQKVYAYKKITSGTVVTYPTDCAKPVFSIDGIAAESKEATAFVGSKISVSCATKDATTIWAYDFGEQTNVAIEGSEFVIPSTAQPGDVYTFAATSEVQGEFEKLTASNYVEVTIAKAPSVATFDFKNNTYNLGTRRSDTMTDACGKTYTDEKSGIIIKVSDSSAGNARLWDDGLRLYTGSSVTFTAPKGCKFVGASYTPSTNISAKMENDNTEYIIKTTSSGKPVETVTLSYIEVQTPATAPEVPAVHEESEVTIADGNSITKKGTLKFNVPEGVKVYYKLETRAPGANDNGENSDNLDNSNIGDDSQTAQRATRADADHSSHDGFAEYDHATGIEINDTHSQLTYIACDPVSGLHSEPVVLAVAIPTGVAEIEAAGEGEAVYFNLQGVRVSGNEPGLYIRVVNGKASKILR